MQQLTSDSFQLGSCQATIATPDGGVVVSKVMKDLYPSLAGHFDGEPIIMPEMPQGAPLEIPRIIIDSVSHEWRFEFSPVRVSVCWRRLQSSDASFALDDLFGTATKILLQYAAQLSPRIARLAALATRFAAHENPGLFLARHFCKDRWDEAPLNRPENFELHAHKEFTMASDFKVNSWARSKTGRLSEEEDGKPVVLFEQDLNTLAEEMPTRDFTDEEVQKFYGAAATELDSILKLYYPHS